MSKYDNKRQAINGEVNWSRFCFAFAIIFIVIAILINT